MISIKKVSVFATALSFAAISYAQENTLMNRKFWGSKPSLTEVQTAIKKGGNPLEMNSSSFNPTVMAILADAPLEDIQYLVDLKENDVNTITHDGRTYLFWAAYKNNLPLVKYLVTNGAAVNIKDAHGIPLMNFATYGKVEDVRIYEYLMKHGADATLTTKDGATLLLLALQYVQDTELLTFFEKNGLSLKDVDDNGNNAFFYAARAGNMKMMQFLKEEGIDYNAKNSAGENAVLYASHGTRGGSPSYETFRYLARLGLEINASNEKGENPLLLSARNNKNFEVIDYLINMNIDVNAMDYLGTTPLLNAVQGNTTEIIRTIADHTEDINHKDSEGHTALMYAVQNADEDAVAYLLHKGGNVDAVDKNGNSLLYYLVNERAGRGYAKKLNNKKLELLKEHGFNIAKQQPNGNNIWHLAVEQQNIKLMGIALANGVDINTKNNEGYTPLLLAAMNAKDTEVLQFLVKNGADTQMKTDFEETAYDLASENEVLQKKKLAISFLK